jgi:hypothetical protein
MPNTSSAPDDNGSRPASTFRTESSTTHHTLDIDGQSLGYRATAEWTTLRRIHKPVAEVFHTSYFVDTVDIRL